MMHVGDDDLFYAVDAASVCAYMLANMFSVLGYCCYFSLLPWRIGGFTFMRCKFTCVFTYTVVVLLHGQFVCSFLT